MVYRGPSSGCKTCQRRKIKCDENDPCRRCLRLGVPCPGVPGKQSKTQSTSRDSQSTRLSPPPPVSTSTTDALINDTGQAVEGSSATQESVVHELPGGTDSHSHPWVDASEDGDSMLVLRPHPTISWKDVGIAKFLSFVRSDPGDTDPWSTMLVDSNSSVDRKSTYFDNALAAVSLQRLSREPYLKELQRQAAVFHGKALRNFGAALQNNVQARSDKSLISVRLLIIYGFNAMYPAEAQSGVGFGDPSQDGPAKDPHTIHTPSTSSNSSPPAESDGPPSPPSNQLPSSTEEDLDPIMHSDPAAAAIAPHLDGLMYMLLIRGPKQLENPSSRKLYHSIRDRIVFNHAKRCRVLPVSRVQPQWQWFFNSPTNSPVDALTNIAIDIPYVRYRAVTLHRQSDASPNNQIVQTLKNDAYSLLSSLETWHCELPSEWRQPRIIDAKSLQLTLGSDCGYQGPGLVYPNPLVALAIGRYHAYKVLLLQVIATSIKAELKYDEYPPRCLVQEYENAIANQREMVDEVCAIVAVYNLRDEKAYELGKEIPPCGMQYGGHLIEPLLVSKTVPSLPAHQMRFLGMKMKEFLGR